MNLEKIFKSSMDIDNVKNEIYKMSKPALEFHHRDIHERLNVIEKNQEELKHMVAEIKALIKDPNYSMPFEILD